MASDVDSFYRQVSLSHADASHYIRAPALAKLPVDDFVNTFFSLHPSTQRVVMMALKGRYEYGRLGQDLKEEKPWIMAVHEVFLERLQKLSAISQYRLKKSLEWYLPTVKPEVESEDKGA
jgi:hypothetical protein